MNIEDKEGMAKLTAQAGVRYLLENPMAYVDGLVREFDCSPSMSVIEGVRGFANWYKSYHL